MSSLTELWPWGISKLTFQLHDNRAIRYWLTLILMNESWNWIVTVKYKTVMWLRIQMKLLHCSLWTLPDTADVNLSYCEHHSWKYIQWWILVWTLVCEKVVKKSCFHSFCYTDHGCDGQRDACAVASVSLHSNFVMVRAEDRIQLLWVQFHEVWIQSQNFVSHFSWFPQYALSFSLPICNMKW